MRVVVAIGLILSQLSLGLLWLLQPDQKLTFDQWIPRDILALIVLTNAPPNLDFLEQTRMKQWLDLDAKRIRQRFPEALRKEARSLFHGDLKSAWVSIHGLQRKSDQALRVAFTALLFPQSLRREALKLRIELAVLNFFGASATSIFERDNIRIYQGKDPGQIFYQIEMPDLILISNSEEGWQKTLRTTTGQTANLASSRSFQRIKSHLPIDGGLFIYFRGDGILSLFPEFGYLIRWENGKFSDHYYEIEKTPW